VGDTQQEPWDLVIGQVSAPFGIRGQLRVRLETDYPERFLRLTEVCLELPSGEQALHQIQHASITHRGVRLTLSGCDTRQAAEALRGAWVKIRSSQAVALPDHSYWVHDLMGMKVVTEEGQDLGEVTEVIRSPGSDVYVTPKAMIPAVRQVVLRVDLEKREMVVSLPQEEEPGL
jgi:16S rRNA processing protein RimM